MIQVELGCCCLRKMETDCNNAMHAVDDALGRLGINQYRVRA